MLALPQEYIGSLCEVKSMSNDLLATGRIIKIDHEALEVSAAQGDSMPLLQYRTPVKLFVYSQKYGTRIQMGVIYLSTVNFVRIEEVRPLQDFERRGAFRVNTDVTASLTALLSESQREALDRALAAAKTAEEAERLLAHGVFEARIMDISLTGMRLWATAPLAVGARYYIEFQLLDAAMSFCLRVQRRIEMPRGEVQYGCIFFDYTERQMDTLCKELFQLQRYEKNRRRNSAAAQ